MKIYLIGFMGAGKTLLGKRLANGLGLKFRDLDDVIEKGEGTSVPAIFREKGEEVFRQIEANYLRSLDEESLEVIATGGGTPCYCENLTYMNENGVTIYLKVSPEKLAERLTMGELDKRPLLSGKSEEELLDFIKTKLGERNFYYENAQFVCEADAPIEEFISSLLGYFERFIPVEKK